MTDDLCEIVVTAPDRDWLVDLCRQLVEARLASSAHVISPIKSIYSWEAQVLESLEARAFLRSRLSLVAAITEYVLPRHPYKVPNITAFPIVDGNPRYMDWVRDETQSS